MIDDPWFYIAAIPAVLVLGLAKGGFGSVGLLVVPILSLAVSPVQAAGIVLPILVLSDLVALYSYWGEWDRRTMAIMLPGALVGVAIGWWTAAWVGEEQIRLILGVISVAFALNYWLRQRRAVHPQPQNVAKGAFWGAVSGFTSFVSHAGGPPYQIYVTPLRLAPRLFA
ncbi:MAG: sulfite exporter TauE/SafE family protein, partial [Hyphomicrobium sp.]|nr:sulfite exporter TauE/SafE family protein [Hyphomicrobium sp.]